MPVTDGEVRKATAAEKLTKWSDGGGLRQWVYPDGAKRW